jgi:anti-sigma regulatory factor (Ser/Thr protein kinase)
VSGPDKAETLARICQLHSSVSGARPADRGPEPVEISEEFPAERTAPGAARRFVAEALQRHGYGGQLLDDVQLVLSELATNAVSHAGSPFLVAARFQGTGVRVAVHDASRAVPTVRDEGPMAPSGRGLQLVAALARDWGVEVTPEGKTVWAELQP